MQLTQKESSTGAPGLQWIPSSGDSGSGSTSSGSGGIEIGSDQHKVLFEHGQIEVQGRDSFSKIQAHLDSQIKK